MLENFVIASDLHRLDVFTSAKSIYRRQSDSEVSLSMSPQCGTGTGYLSALPEPLSLNSQSTKSLFFEQRRIPPTTRGRGCGVSVILAPYTKRLIYLLTFSAVCGTMSVRLV